MFGTIKISLDLSCPTAAKTIKSRDLSAFYMEIGRMVASSLFFEATKGK